MCVEERSRSFFINTYRVPVLGFSKVLDHSSFFFNKSKVLDFSILALKYIPHSSFSPIFFLDFSAILHPYILSSRFFLAYLLLYNFFFLHQHLKFLGVSAFLLQCMLCSSGSTHFTFSLDLSDLTHLKLSTRLAGQTYHQCLCLGSLHLFVNESLFTFRQNC